MIHPYILQVPYLMFDGGDLYHDIRTFYPSSTPKNFTERYILRLIKAHLRKQISHRKDYLSLHNDYLSIYSISEALLSHTQNIKTNVTSVSDNRN